MFRQYAKTMSLTSHGVDVAKLTVEMIVRNNPITPEAVKKIRMPDAIRERLQAAWAAFTGPVKNNGDFEFEHNLHESRHGLILGVVKWKNGKFDVGFVAIPMEEGEEGEDDDEDEAPPIILFESIANKNPPTDEITWLDEIWTAFNPVVPIVRTERVILPNDPCTCGSGKKFKKCCGRLV